MQKFMRLNLWKNHLRNLKNKKVYKEFFIEKLALGNEDGDKQIYSANQISEKASLEKI